MKRKALKQHKLQPGEARVSIYTELQTSHGKIVKHFERITARAGDELSADEMAQLEEALLEVSESVYEHINGIHEDIEKGTRIASRGNPLGES